MTISDDYLTGWTEKFQSRSFTKAKLAPKTMPLAGCCWPEPVQLFNEFLVKPSRKKSMCGKRMRCAQSYNGYKNFQFSMTTSNCTSHNQHFQSWNKSGWEVLPHPPCSCQLTTTASGTLPPFYRETLPSADNASQEFLESGFYAHFSLTKGIDYNSSYSD